MGKEKTSQNARYPVRLSAEAKRRMTVLAADAGKKIEEFGAEVLTESLDRLYAEYVKRISRESR